MKGDLSKQNGAKYMILIVELATNKPVCTISVIHSQITEPERVIKYYLQS